MKNKIIVWVILLLVILLGVYFLVSKGEGELDQEVSVSEPVDVVLEFYEPWLAALNSTSTDPYKEDLHKSPILSKELRKKIADNKESSEEFVDAVMCQKDIPKTISATFLHETEEEAGVLVLARTQGLTGQAVAKLKKHNEGWYIDDIECRAGEFGEDREFTFEREGFLLKSVPAPLDSNYWHIVFEEDGKPGHFAPLKFDDQSSCVSKKGEQNTCDTNQFEETAEVKVYGQMTETGVEVQRVEFK